MTNEIQKEKIYDLRERLLIFAKRIIELSRAFPKGPDCDVLKKQLIRSGTSIGANYEEADGAVSKKDFLNKLAIARKEARETKYWLRVLSGSILEHKTIKDDIQETSEIVKILSSMINKTKK